MTTPRPDAASGGEAAAEAAEGGKGVLRGGKGGVPLKENDSSNKPATKAAAVKTGAVRVAPGSSRPASAVPKKAAAPSTVLVLCIFRPAVPR